jgi:hypothetical protein
MFPPIIELGPQGVGLTGDKAEKTTGVRAVPHSKIDLHITNFGPHQCEIGAFRFNLHRYACARTSILLRRNFRCC